MQYLVIGTVSLETVQPVREVCLVSKKPRPVTHGAV